ncbi:hypothetical protein K8S19_02965 [bacterium]|nr:hypothetical protein [bacterium]
MTDSSQDEKIFNNEGCLRGIIIFTIIVLVLVGILALVVYLRPQNMLRYGLITSITELEEKVGLERTLPDEQYKELKVYLRSVKKYISENELDKEIIGRVGPINEVFKVVLQDGRINRDELAEIRAVMWRSNIPLDVPEKKQSGDSSETSK